MAEDRYRIDLLVQGFPGRSRHHGGLGWSSVTLLRGDGHVALVDTGSFGMRSLLRGLLDDAGVAPGEVTDVLLTHVHYDHAASFGLFPDARVWIGAAELEWACGRGPRFDAVPELYAEALRTSDRTRQIRADGELIPGVSAFAAPGHTPGSTVYLADTGGTHLLLTGDAAKNRAELLQHRADMTLDAAASEQSFARIWDLWRSRPGTVLVPGHDVPMRLDDDGAPVYCDTRRAAVDAWFDDTLERMHTFDLSGPEATGDHA